MSVMDWFDPTSWTHTGAVAAVAMVMAAIVHRIATVVLRRATGQVPVLRAVFEACVPVVRVLLPLIALQLVWQAASDDLRHIATVRHFNGLAVIAGTCWLLIAASVGWPTA